MVIVTLKMMKCNKSRHERTLRYALTYIYGLLLVLLLFGAQKLEILY